MLQSLDDRLHRISTIILSTWPSSQANATGFFFQELEPRDPQKVKNRQGQWRQIQQLWLVTNKHVLVDGTGALATSITFHHRKMTEAGFAWLPTTVSADDLRARCLFHRDDAIDVAIVRVLDLFGTISDRLPETEGAIPFSAVTEDDFPGKNKIKVEVGDDVLVVGYPRGFYDQLSKFPIVKAGVIASRWGMPFGGKPFFLIDAKLFPGSSGSLVISKPTSCLFEAGQIYLHSSGSKQFAFLGVFSGEPFRQTRPIETDNFTIISKEGYSVGIVWYSQLVTDIIRNGKHHNES